MVLAMDRALVPSIGRGLRRDQFGDADQIVGDQVEQEIGSNGGDAAVLGLAHCTVLFAPAEDAFGHRPARLRIPMKSPGHSEMMSPGVPT